ncbi:MAG: 50S ribosomal protein L35 [Candidatus Pacebacteria bacterium CG_4_10_14_0_8_um_filter_43_12]|nr:MAG: 50S ribosomal protein L35 [Candidatus Pacebacteria bacterium CG10_big_fil_rev_8_21_14_0_10_44_11]PIY79220.1 MAG: 50S ribosomal protein L35 [Candidatus Pacebacteria bacterium CG_4_10_14_0_8_um_filter_43_12]
MSKIKQRTRSGVAKRFKITATGKVLRRAQNMRHRRRIKSKKAIRAYRRPIEVKGKWARKIKRMLGIA